jgi:sugar lactone lactonase YvrE
MQAKRNRKVTVPTKERRYGRMHGRSKSVGVAMALMLLVALLAAALAPVQAGAGGHIEVLRVYDATAGELPEGVAVDKVGNLYVSFTPLGQIRKITADGTDPVVVDFGDPGTLGLAVDAVGNLYAAHASVDLANRGVYRLGRNGVLERFAGTEDMLFPNSLAFDKRGNLYVTDSAMGTIWRITRRGDAASWLQHELLEGLGLIPGYPPIGANGIVYWKGMLYVANTEKGLIVRIPLSADGSPGEPEVVADGPGVYGPDGLALDVFGNLYIPLVIQDKLVRLDPEDGTVVELATVDDDLDEPASLAFSTQKGDRKAIFLTSYAVLPEDGGAGPAVLKVEIGVPGRPLP